MKRKIFGRVLLVSGLLMLIAAVVFAGVNLRESRRAQESASRRAKALITAMDGAGKTIAAPDPERVPEAAPVQLSLTELGDPVITVEESAYIGLLEIPALELSLPVLADWSYENLEECPCRFYGSCAKNDLVICGHNYLGHFAPLWNVDIGVDVYFTTADRTVYHYVVSNRETLGPNDVDKMIGADQKDWDLTLFTCTLGAQSRCTVRCIRIDG